MKMTSFGWVAVLALGLPACAGIGQARGSEPSSPPPGIDGGGSLLVGAGDAIERIDAGSGEVLFSFEHAVVSADGSALYAVRATATGSELVRADPATGEVSHAQPVPAGLQASAASQDGRVALIEAGSATFPDAPAGRATTPVRIAATGPNAAGPSMAFELDGNFEPEAFSVRGRGLFLIEYLPPEAPDHYRVAQLDLQSGDISAVLSPDKVPSSSPQSPMQGERIQRALAPDGSVMYTLYKSYALDSSGIAFVHMLSLEGRWAHCIDMPEEMAMSPTRNKALALSPDGKRLYVTDAGTDQIVTIEPGLLAVVETASVDIPEPPTSASAQAAVSADGVLYVAAGSTLTRFDVSGQAISPLERWEMPAVITDVAVPGDGSIVDIVAGGQVYARRAASGLSAGSVLADGVDRILAVQ